MSELTHPKKSFQWLWIILVAAIIVRVFASFSSFGFNHPNEIHRLLEPIAEIQGYSTVTAWEWKEGYLSTVSPQLHAGILQIAEMFGFNQPLSQYLLIKILNSLLSLSLIWFALFYARKLGLSYFKQIMIALYFSFWPEFVFQSVRLMDYALEAPILAVCLYLFLRENKKLFLCGCLLGLLFFIRFQTGIYLISFILILIFSERKIAFQGVVRLVSGYAVILIGLGLIDFFRFKLLWEPFWNYLFYHIVDNGASRDYGVDPWHRYITDTLKYVGWLPLLLIPLLFQRGFKILSWKLLFVFLFSFVVHSFIGHKEGRFLYGSIWILPLWLLIQVHLNNRVSKVFLIVVLVVSFTYSAIRVNRKWSDYSQDVRSWSAVGEFFQQHSQYSQLPLLINADPDFSPGGFFLRTQGKLCYVFLRQSQEECKRSISHDTKNGLLHLKKKSELKTGEQPLWQDTYWSLEWARK